MKDSMRQCPTYDTSEEPLFTHMISRGTCENAQARFYHKCGKCIFRSQGAHLEIGSIHDVARPVLCATGSDG